MPGTVPPAAGEDEIARIFRAESGRSVAALISAFGDIDVAEDAVQEAAEEVHRPVPKGFQGRRLGPMLCSGEPGSLVGDGEDAAD